MPGSIWTFKAIELFGHLAFAFGNRLVSCGLFYFPVHEFFYSINQELRVSPGNRLVSCELSARCDKRLIGSIYAPAAAKMKFALFNV